MRIAPAVDDSAVVVEQQDRVREALAEEHMTRAHTRGLRHEPTRQEGRRRLLRGLGGGRECARREEQGQDCPRPRHESSPGRGGYPNALARGREAALPED